MDEIPTEFQDHELIKIAKVFWRYDPTLRDRGWGHPLPYYFDRTSNVFRVFDFAGNGVHYESAELLTDGLHDIELEKPWQHARDTFTMNIEVNVK